MTRIQAKANPTNAADSALEILRAMLTRILDYFVPPACPLCRAPLQTRDGLCGGCWQQLDFITAPLCYRTGVPLPFEAAVDGEGQTISLPSLMYPPVYERARAALYYEGAGARLVREFKFYDRPEIATILAQWMHRTGHEFWQREQGEKVWLVPVPLHRRRFLWRRYNQAAELCRALSEHSEGAAQIPILFDALVRVRATPRQVGLSRSRRMRNLGRAFQVRPQMQDALRGARVILIDDVVTTGTTIEACTKILKRAGVVHVDVLTAARVVMPERI